MSNGNASNFNNPVESYEGSEDYAYVSYSYKDADIVFPNLAVFNKLGVHVFYNEDPSKENYSPKCNATKIKNSKIFIPFLTSNAAFSKICHKDICLASLYGIPFIPIYLEETNLDDGLNLIIEEEKPIFKYDLSDDEYYDMCKEELNDIFLSEKEKESKMVRLFKNFFVTGKKANILDSDQESDNSDAEFIYMSFSHEDISLVFKDLQLLKSNEIYFKFDEEIDFNKNDESDLEWQDEIKTLIKDCSFFVFYLSEKSLISKRRIFECNCAIEFEKPICLVHIEEVDKIPFALEIHFDNKAVIIKYEMDWKEYETEYLKSLGLQ
ncbi:hypothetical protein [Methanobrevibacter sp.]